MSLFEELKRRNVIRVAVLYLVSSWVLLQLTDVLSSLLKVPESVGSIVVLLLILGFIPVVIFAWAYEMTPEGVKRQAEVDRSLSITAETGKRINTLIIVLLVVAIAVVVLDRLLPAVCPRRSAGSDSTRRVKPHHQRCRRSPSRYCHSPIFRPPVTRNISPTA